MNKKINRTTVISLLSALLIAPAFAEKVCEIDASHTSVGFAVRHLGLSKVKGHFKEVSGTITLDDENKATAADVVVKIASVDTGNKKRDDHLLADDFFDNAKFPEMTFKSKSVEGDKMTGDLTIHGITKEVTLTFTLNGPVKDPWENTKIGVEATGEINRKDYKVGMETPKLMVAEDVSILIEVEATLK